MEHIEHIQYIKPIIVSIVVMFLINYIQEQRQQGKD